MVDQVTPKVLLSEAFRQAGHEKTVFFTLALRIYLKIVEHLESFYCCLLFYEVGTRLLRGVSTPAPGHNFFTCFCVLPISPTTIIRRRTCAPARSVLSLLDRCHDQKYDGGDSSRSAGDATS